MKNDQSQEIKRIIAENLKKQREKKGLSQRDLADLCGWGQSRIGNYETGTNGIDYPTAEVIAIHLGLQTVDILCGGLETRVNDDIQVKMCDSSMEGSTPAKYIPFGAEVIISKAAKDSYVGLAVLVQLNDNSKPLIKEFQSDGVNAYLISWNANFEPIKLTNEYKIIGSVDKYLFHF